MKVFDLQALKPYLGYVLTDISIPELPNHYHGKVRDNYDLPNGQRILIASDRLSAFDRHITSIPLKGQVLTQIARFWFEQTADICPNHVIEYPDPNVLVCKRLTMMPVEVVVRDYLAGTTSTSILAQYKKGARVIYGHSFAQGMQPNQKLPNTIMTPTTKAAHGEHDAPLTDAEVVEKGLLPKEKWAETKRIALALFARGREIAAARGLILVDTKYEFGFDENGNIVLADEIHTPDSSRYWVASSYKARFDKGENPESLDKDFIRTWISARCNPYTDDLPEISDELILQAASVYIQVYEMMTGRAFECPSPDSSVLARVRENLKSYF